MEFGVIWPKFQQKRKPLSFCILGFSTNKYINMNSSFLYHAWGLGCLECTKEEYKGNTII